MINFYMYWYWTRFKVFCQRKRNAVRKYWKRRFKRYCTCPYTVKAGRGEVICPKCKGAQKNSGWK